MSSASLAILSGPSCVGKGPLVAALKRFYPDLAFTELPVIKSKQCRADNKPRPDEEAVWDNPDYFRETNADILELGNARYVVGECRKFPQAVDLDKVRGAKTGLFFAEVYHTIGAQIRQKEGIDKVRLATVFVSPLGRQEIMDLATMSAGAGLPGVPEVKLPDYLTHLMIHKQLIRARYQGKAIDNKFIEDANERANDSISELTSACTYSHVIVNHDGEGSPNWCRLPNGVFTGMPVGNAGRAVSSLVDILSNSAAIGVENWESFVLPWPKA